MIASLIGKYIQQMKEGDQAWLGLGFLTDSTLIKKKHKHLF
jgi:hypothetical protein